MLCFNRTSLFSANKIKMMVISSDVGLLFAVGVGIAPRTTEFTRRQGQKS